ncbi:hypothetical protein ACWDAZ_36940 [Streptomyces sp. NPDC001215]
MRERYAHPSEPHRQPQQVEPVARPVPELQLVPPHGESGAGTADQSLLLPDSGDEPVTSTGRRQRHWIR